MKTIWESWTGHAGLLFAVTFWMMMCCNYDLAFESVMQWLSQDVD